MYQHYFGLDEAPFSIAPAPRFLYMSQRHQEALAHLLYGLGGEGGFVLLTGEVGAGKTTVCRCLLEQIPEACDLAYVFNPKLTVEELLSTICAEFGIDCPPDNGSVKVFVDRINAHLLEAHARGRHAVLIIDEAQNLSADVLEQMRLLTNLETSERKLLQIILLGQPELATMLARPELRQLAQRIVARYHLGPLSKAEVAAYVRHRLEVAGTHRPLFPATLMGRLYRLSGGVPRIINVLCDRALLGTFAQGKERVDRATLAQAAREVFGPPTHRRRFWPRALAAGLLLLAGGALAVIAYQQAHRPAPTPAITAKPAPPPAKLAATTPDRLLWPDGASGSPGEAAARIELFKTWGVDYRGGVAPCRRAESAGLSCRTARGRLEELRQINRPALLRILDERGREFFATLVALGDHAATFTIAGAPHEITLGLLERRWSGHYQLLWRPPHEVRDTIRPGDRGAAVVWLRAALTPADSRVDAAAATVFDDALAREVKRFQLAQGLTPDGAVGEQTLIRLLGVVDRAAPRLAREPGTRSGPVHE
ncbi:MAG: AAA family ATPase [Pseudomonadota bacterium]|nr:AAA family ATPase [Pseudomonadota bacterium]MDP1902750.1 AAA family ATPase [Pseudomonadota bacterium]MDP2350984.1 AAA family ATPase [Pseudomonadota bacterium]